MYYTTGKKIEKLYHHERGNIYISPEKKFRFGKYSPKTECSSSKYYISAFLKE